MPRRALRVLHVPAVVGGNAVGLARAERELGLDSRVVAFEPPPYGYDADEVLFAHAGPLRRELRRWRFLARALREADVVHFNFGSGILPRYYQSVHARGLRRLYGAYARLVEGRELSALRRAGKGVVVTFQGDDARTAASIRPRLGSHTDWLGDYYDARDDARKAQVVARFDAHAHAIFALNPDLLDVLPERAEFLPYASVDPRAVEIARPPRNDPPVVVHLPSDRRVKGTDHVVAAARALGLDLRLVEGVSHEEALRELAAADVVVDQLLIGWYGGVAVEAMALGRPVVAHLHSPDLARIPAAMRDELPVVDATPESLADVLRKLLASDRTELERRGRRYVERWHDPRAVAERVIDVYERSVALTG